MNLQEQIAAAGITRVAIVDDDLSGRISSRDLQSVDRDAAAVLADRQDPDRAMYVELLARLGTNTDELVDLAEPLSYPEVRQQAPARLRDAAEQVLAVRRDSAEPIRRIQELLEALGIARASIDHFSTPEVPAARRYDLLIVDYFLHEGSQEATLPFVRAMLDAHREEPVPLQLILMSSHELELRSVFQELRPELRISSSRMRIMGKPNTGDQLLQWKLALNQLAADRANVRVVEAFAEATARSVREAAEHVARRVWELDLQAMDLLHETAVGDNDDYSRYVEECLSRQLLARLEELTELRASLISLGQNLAENRSSKVISPPAEIGDSRAALRALMSSVEWRGGAAAPSSAYPVNGTPLDKSKWVRCSLRFGMVLRSGNGQEWLNLTQACDLAQAADEDLATTCLLLIAGQRYNPIDQPDSEAVISMTTCVGDTGTEVIGWNLLRTFTPTVREFGGVFSNGWSTVGEMRIDQAQSIAVEYGTRAARVGLLKRLSVWRLEGLAMTARTLVNSHADDALTGTAMSGSARARGDSMDEIHIDRESFDRLLTTFPGALDDRALALYAGAQAKRGKKAATTPPLVYCTTKPASMRALRLAFSNEQWLTRPDSADKVLLALWPKVPR